MLGIVIAESEKESTFRREVDTAKIVLIHLVVEALALPVTPVDKPDVTYARDRSLIFGRF